MEVAAAISAAATAVWHAAEQEAEAIAQASRGRPWCRKMFQVAGCSWFDVEISFWMIQVWDVETQG